MAGVTAFREAYMSADIADAEDFTDFTARQMRYRVLWSFFENSAYRDVHKWAASLRSSYGMYKYSRNIYNPAYRLGTFWQAFLMGGSLDPDAGDGEEKPSALPILTGNDRLRPALGQLWLNSNWAIRKNVFTLWGAVLGDVALRIVDDPEREKVYLSIVHPGTLARVMLDAYGNVKGYMIEERRADPAGKVDEVVYQEVASRDGVDVVYQTFRDGKPFGWDGNPAEWRVPYGFIPMVVVKHVDVGLDWGWAEMFPALSKVREADDLASKVSDQIRKAVDAPWFFAGVSKPKSTPKAEYSSADDTDLNQEPGREEIPALYAPLGAQATALVANLDLAASVGHIKDILAEIERDFPELQHDIWSAQGDTSGRALRVARQKVEAKVLDRRANYDDALLRAQQMGVAIGGYRRYAGFEGFGLDSYGRGDLDHRIDPDRPVFPRERLDDLALEREELSVENLRVSLDQQRALLTGR